MTDDKSHVTRIVVYNNRMKRVLIGVFAHPDDEAFGPSGTLLKEVKDGTELHLICATRGEAGVNPDGHDNLGATRQAEWQQSCRLLGAASTLQLDYPDGGLSNRLYLETADKIKARLKTILAGHQGPVDLQFITFEPGGITGHLDHVAISLITAFVCERLRTKPPKPVKTIGLRYFCLSAAVVPHPNTDWLYMPPGRPESQIDEQIDVRDVLEQKIAVMDTHHSQRADATYFKQLDDALKTECFYYG